MNEYMINVAKQFARSPAGRVPTDGPNSGTRFREQFLLPALRAHDKVIVELDGTRGYGSSFLDEAFGSIVRSGIFTAQELLNKIELRSTDPSLPLEIRSYFSSSSGGSASPTEAVRH